jgi:signal transduction histidine kinase
MFGSSARSGRRFAVLVMTSTCVLFIAIVSGVSGRLRMQLHDQILRREAESLQAVALMQLSAPEVRLIDLGFTDPTEDIFAALLESTRLRGVLSLELFDPDHDRRAALPEVPEWAPFEPIASDGLTVRGRLHRRLALAASDDSTSGQPTATVPVFEVVIALAPADFAGWSARYWVDGTALAQELRQLDRAVLVQAAAALGAGLLALLTLLGWAFGRLRAYHHSLSRRTVELAQANQELVFAAKTSAIGALSAHLLHGIKNPILGLEGLAMEQVLGSAQGTNPEAWKLAVESARRVRTLVSDVLEVLQSEGEPATGATVPVRAVLDQARTRAAAVLTARAVTVEQTAPSATVDEVPTRTASLATFILANLLENAAEASPAGERIQLQTTSDAGSVQFSVSDHGPGLPEPVRERLFQPVHSTRGGSGLGLAISHRLAQHAGGDLALISSDNRGTTFRLTVPAIPTPPRPTPIRDLIST